jgi:hypothetical protein
MIFVKVFYGTFRKLKFVAKLRGCGFVLSTTERKRKKNAEGAERRKNAEEVF